MKTVPELLIDGANVYKQRQSTYGDNYKKFGNVMVGLFPNGLLVETAEEWNKLGLILNCVTKLARYCGSDGGHQDSANDLKVYAAMLEEITQNGS